MVSCPQDEGPGKDGHPPRLRLTLCRRSEPAWKADADTKAHGQGAGSQCEQPPRESREWNRSKRSWDKDQYQKSAVFLCISTGDWRLYIYCKYICLGIDLTKFELDLMMETIKHYREKAQEMDVRGRRRSRTRKVAAGGWRLLPLASRASPIPVRDKGALL